MKLRIDHSLWRFILVGICNTVLGAAMMFGLYNLAGCSYWISSAANYILVSIFSFFLNKKFTFRDRSSLGGSALRFAVHIGICYFLAYGLAERMMLYLLQDTGEALRENLAMLVGMVFFTGLNYLGQRFFVFGRKV